MKAQMILLIALTLAFPSWTPFSEESDIPIPTGPDRIVGKEVENLIGDAELQDSGPCEFSENGALLKGFCEIYPTNTDGKILVVVFIKIQPDETTILWVAIMAGYGNSPSTPVSEESEGLFLAVQWQRKAYWM